MKLFWSVPGGKKGARDGLGQTLAVSNRAVSDMFLPTRGSNSSADRGRGWRRERRRRERVTSFGAWWEAPYARDGSGVEMRCQSLRLCRHAGCGMFLADGEFADGTCTRDLPSRWDLELLSLAADMHSCMSVE